MKIFYQLLVTVIIVFISINLKGQINGDDIVGVWMTPENLSAVEIYKNGKGYCGKIVWEKEPNDKFGNPKKDIKNPGSEKRNKLIHGLVIIKQLRFDGKKEWVKGIIYNPESGKTYKIKVELLNKNTLKLRGYIGVSLIGRTSIWKRKV